MDTAWLIDSLPCAVVVLREDGVVHYASPAFVDLAGQDPTGQGFPDLIAPIDRDAVAANRKNGGGARYRLVHASGEWILVEEQGAWRDEGGVRRYVILMRDARGHARREAEDLVRQRLRALGQLSAGVTHEINNQLAGVLNYSQLALRLELDDKLRKIIESVEASGRKVLETTQALMTYAGGEVDGLLTLVPGEVAQACFTLLRRGLRDEHILFSTEVDPELPMIATRGRPVQQILLELLENARWALSERYPARDPDKVLVIRVRPDGARAVFEVEDHGVGVSSDEDPFRPFWTTRAGSLGLGLTLAGELARQHGGSLELIPRADGGTLARLSLPITP